MRGERLIKANRIARRTFKYYNGFNPRNRKQPTYFYKMTEGEINRYLGIYRKTRVTCSRVCCGNPRRHFGFLTKQEVKQIQAAEQDIREELGVNPPKKIKFVDDW